MRLALPRNARAELEPRLPGDVEARWFSDTDEAFEALPGVEAAWLDLVFLKDHRRLVEASRDARWIFTAMAGVNGWPLDLFEAQGQVLTNGAGINAIPVAEFAVMGVMAMSKGLRELIYCQDRKEWPAQAPGRVELYQSKALVIGYGHIGREIGKRLVGLGIEVTGVRRTPANDPNVIGPGDWRSRLGEFDWIVLASAATPETERMIGQAELEAMKPTARLVNIARGALIDQAALIEAVKVGRLAGALLDVTDPEPPAQDDPVWSTPGILMTCHCSGRSQMRMAERASDLFLENLGRFRRGESLKNVVDLKLGY